MQQGLSCSLHSSQATACWKDHPMPIVEMSGAKYLTENVRVSFLHVHKLTVWNSGRKCKANAAWDVYCGPDTEGTRVNCEEQSSKDQWEKHNVRLIKKRHWGIRRRLQLRRSNTAILFWCSDPKLWKPSPAGTPSHLPGAANCVQRQLSRAFCQTVQMSQRGPERQWESQDTVN